MHIHEVGTPYNPARQQWPEGAWYQCRNGEHELLLTFKGISRPERLAVAKGRADFAILERQPAIFLLYQFGDAIQWSDSPFSIHLVSDPAERAAPPDPTGRILLTTFLVEASSGLIERIRVCSLSEKFGTVLAEAIRRQHASAFDPTAYDRCLGETYARFPNTKQMLREAAIIETGGKV